MFQSGNGEIRLLNPSQPPRRHAATGHAAQADKRDTSAPPFVDKADKQDTGMMRTNTFPSGEVMQHWAGEVPLNFLCGSDFFIFSRYSAFEFIEEDSIQERNTIHSYIF